MWLDEHTELIRIFDRYQDPVYTEVTNEISDVYDLLDADDGELAGARHHAEEINGVDLILVHSEHIRAGVLLNQMYQHIQYNTPEIISVECDRFVLFTYGVLHCSVFEWINRRLELIYADTLDDEVMNVVQAVRGRLSDLYRILRRLENKLNIPSSRDCLSADQYSDSIREISDGARQLGEVVYPNEYGDLTVANMWLERAAAVEDEDINESSTCRYIAHGILTHWCAQAIMSVEW